MSTTVAAIADAAFDAVAAKITGVIKTCTVTSTTQGAYNTSTGTYSTTTSTQTGRALFAGVQDNGKPITDIFPDYVAGPADELILLEGLTAAPEENDTVTIGSTTRTIMKVNNIVGAGTLFYVMAR